ncbi:uncharacterized protein LOC111880233 [Lactuca sativa]|uniref:uncharacterized protein LOC111880233 n=1 Tax=Lactuca sativa TaxID=4236 RepID=UPI000CD950C0|nr:uncharacterized protein LOC111880233 [Lactuca sativa]XP_023732411.1 uncharacterized protein LOC111880233 [Lactuca sativa]XP_023732412.1 uncharacterized protein LOC111880233 [Lactuca sativa]
MASEASSSGQWLQQDSGSTILKDGVVVVKSSNNNISLRTGEEFSMEFLQDRGTRRIPNGHDTNEKMVGSKSDVSGNLGFNEISGMLGLQRREPVVPTDNISAKGPLSMASAPVMSLPHRASGSGAVNDSQRGKIKFLCSSGGKILPRPSDGKLRYVGGETHIFSIHKNISFDELVNRTGQFCNQPHTIKYQLPGEDLDALISVSSNEDLQNMIEEYNGVGICDGSSRLRIFLIPLTELESTVSIESNANLQNSPDYQYVAAVNGIADDGLNNSTFTSHISEPRILVAQPDPSLFVSPVLMPQNDLIDSHAQVYNDPLSDSIEIPILKGRAFHSENRILPPSDPVNLCVVGSNGSQLGIPHAFSDPQLKEHGSTSAFGSQDGSNFPSTLTFPPPPLPSQLTSSFFQGNSVEQHDNFPPQILFEMPNLNHEDAMHSHETHQDVKQDLSQNVGLQLPNIVSASTESNIRTTTMAPNYNNLSDADKSLNDLLSHLSHGLVQQSSSHQKESNGQNPNLIDALESTLHDSSLNQIPTTGAKFTKEVNLIDDNFNYTELKPAELGNDESQNKIQKEIPSSKVKEEIQLELNDPLGDVNVAISHSQLLGAVSTEALPSSEIEAEDIHLESDIEDAVIENGGSDGPFNNALIAEMEADMYGLQIIKNAELEELKELGSGTYGTVYHGRWRGSDVAIKRIKKSCFSGRSSEQERLTNDFWREARILSNLHHPNVVAFYGVVPDGAGGTLATVTEFMTHGSLRNVLIKKDRSLDRRRKLIIAMDAAFGMEYLHMKNIVHFDLKCDNLLVNMRDPQRPICKVGDFGLSRIKRNTLVSGGVRGTLPWMAPELLNGSTTRVSEKVDVFSFGITMWEILTAEEPYANMHCGAIIGGIVKDTLRPTIPERCDPEWKKLMEQCWSADPTVRPSFTEITNRLRTMSKALQANGHKKPQHV